MDVYCISKLYSTCSGKDVLLNNIEVAQFVIGENPLKASVISRYPCVQVYWIDRKKDT